ncbi:MAG: putative membrane-anchored protein [Oceanospirillaceae bacterium]|jgi:uncharacterized membrane-anchored protein
MQDQQIKISGIQYHPLLESLYEEMHSRPYQVIPCPAKITHFVLISDEEQKAQQFACLQELFAVFSQPVPSEDQSNLQFETNTFRVRREVHLEFSAFTFTNLALIESTPFQQTGLTPLPDGWIESLPGTVMANFHIALQCIDDQDKALISKAKQYFEGYRLVGSSPQNGDARVWTSFKLHSDGFGRFLIGNAHMSDSQIGRLTQRVIEIETYRMLTLMALPLARENSARLSIMDSQLVLLTNQLACADDFSEQEILVQLTQMAAQIEAVRSRTAFRYAATFAYYELVLKRLAELREDEVSGHLSLNEFITRRLTPAVNTCRAVSERLESLSLRIDRVSDMMRTKVELSIQQQNQLLLQSMDRRSGIQLMMQHTVEGLSVAAISYYSIGLVKYLIESFDLSNIPFSKAQLVGGSVPLVIGAVWFFTRRVHKRFKNMDDEKS